MTFDDLGHWTNRLGAGEKLGAAAKRRIEAELPEFIRNLSPASAPTRPRLPTGESLTNATRMTALKCQCVLLARTAFGANFIRANEEYEHLAKDVLFWVMRHAFNSSDPKGFSVARHALFPCFPCMRPPAFAGLIATNWHPMSSEPWTKVHRFFARAYPKAYAEWAVSVSSRTSAVNKQIGEYRWIGPRTGAAPLAALECSYAAPGPCDDLPVGGSAAAVESHRCIYLRERRGLHRFRGVRRLPSRDRCQVSPDRHGALLLPHGAGNDRRRFPARQHLLSPGIGPPLSYV